jgi:hypothetical protein
MGMAQRFSGFRFVVYLVGFTSLLLLRLAISPNGESGMLTWLGCVALLAVGYMVWYAASEGYLRNLGAGVIVWLAIAAVVAACPPFALLLVFWSVTGLIRQRRALLMHAFASIALFVLVFPMPFARLAGMPELAGAPAGLAYCVFALTYAALASRNPLKLGLFKFSTMLVSVPLIASFVALVGGGMLNRPERRIRNTMRARRAATIALPVPAMPVMPLAVLAGASASAEMLMPAAIAIE